MNDPVTINQLEYVILRDKAKAYDEGEEKWGVLRACGEIIHLGTERACEAMAEELNDNPMFEDGYTFKPVILCLKAVAV